MVIDAEPDPVPEVAAEQSYEAEEPAPGRSRRAKVGPEEEVTEADAA